MSSIQTFAGYVVRRTANPVSFGGGGTQLSGHDERPAA